MNSGALAKATFFECGKELSAFLFRMPILGDRDFYRQSVSIKCFRKRQSKISDPNVKRCEIRIIPPSEEINSDSKSLKLLPTVFDMYDAIGYDYKRQEWKYRFKEKP